LISARFYLRPGFFDPADSKGVRDGTAGNEGEDVGVDGQQFKVERGKIRRAKRGLERKDTKDHGQSRDMGHTAIFSRY
jgi:hypothetical protein